MKGLDTKNGHHSNDFIKDQTLRIKLKMMFVKFISFTNGNFIRQKLTK